jgi:hypothetical protein
VVQPWRLVRLGARPRSRISWDAACATRRGAGIGDMGTCPLTTTLGQTAVAMSRTPRAYVWVGGYAAWPLRRDTSRDGLAAARLTGEAVVVAVRHHPTAGPSRARGQRLYSPGLLAGGRVQDQANARSDSPPGPGARVHRARTLRLVSSRMHFAAGCSLLLAVRAGSSNSTALTHCAANTSPTHHASAAGLPILFVTSACFIRSPPLVSVLKGQWGEKS